MSLFTHKGNDIVADLVCDLSVRGEAMSKNRVTELAKLIENKELLRSKLQSNKQLYKVENKPTNIEIYAVDGAYIMNDKLAYSDLVLTAILAKETEGLMGRSRLLQMPHLQQSQVIASALMTLLEISLITLAEAYTQCTKDGLILIDGSRYSMWIHLKQLMEANEETLELITEYTKEFPEWELLKNESMVGFLQSENIIGLQKLVTSQVLTKQLNAIIPEVDLMRYNDKAIALLLLEDNEVLVLPAVPVDTRCTTYIDGLTHENFKNLTTFSHINDDEALWSCYIKMPNQTVIKVEVLGSFIKKGRLGELKYILETQCTDTLQEPYINWVVDKLCKEAVKIGQTALDALPEENDIITEILNHGYRT